jgi:hypothetical protein
MADDDERGILGRALQLNDIPFVVALEQASFPPNEAATPEKVESPDALSSQFARLRVD